MNHWVIQLTAVKKRDEYLNWEHKVKYYIDNKYRKSQSYYEFSYKN